MPPSKILNKKMWHLLTATDNLKQTKRLENSQPKTNLS